MAVWSSSVVSLLYEAIYSSVSCTKMRRLESVLVAVLLSAANYNC